MDRRLPAEWEPQDAVLLAWPPGTGNYGPAFHVGAARTVFSHLVAAISRHQRVLLLVNDAHGVERLLERAGADLTRVRLEVMPFNDFWSRDFGPITLLEAGRPTLLDFTFNGWGGKYQSGLDDQVTGRLHQRGVFGACPLRQVPMVLEGGSIDSDGRGTILTTAPCLLHPTRNPGLARDAIAARLTAELGVTRVLWLEHGAIKGDDTDSHVDMLARFADPGTILHGTCPEPADWHHEPLTRMAAELAALRTATGQPYRLLPLPIPAPIHDREGRRLAASYANFLIINGAVLLPVYDDPRDAEAVATLAGAFPGRAIVPINCRPLILENGSLHCVTMQLPAGTLPA